MNNKYDGIIFYWADIQYIIYVCNSTGHKIISQYCHNIYSQNKTIDIYKESCYKDKKCFFFDKDQKKLTITDESLDKQFKDCWLYLKKETNCLQWNKNVELNLKNDR